MKYVMRNTKQPAENDLKYEGWDVDNSVAIHWLIY